MIPKSLLFLFSSTRDEELAAGHVIREHHRGRALEEILQDPYVQNRCDEEQIGRLLDRPEIMRAVWEDLIAANRMARADRL
ncbi:MAG TPA: hypothetical protein VG652_06800 [Gaiellaceae bacterium]|nr:hypothetical protein [Gaiellaceae bacterium]